MARGSTSHIVPEESHDFPVGSAGIRTAFRGFGRKFLLCFRPFGLGLEVPTIDFARVFGPMDPWTMDHQLRFLRGSCRLGASPPSAWPLRSRTPEGSVDDGPGVRPRAFPLGM